MSILLYRSTVSHGLLPLFLCCLFSRSTRPMLDSSGVAAYTLGKSFLYFPCFQNCSTSSAASYIVQTDRRIKGEFQSQHCFSLALFTSSNMMLPIKPVQLALQFESRDITGIFKSILSDAHPSLLLALHLVSPPPRSRLFWKWALAPAAS